jgi:hypothetical protein
LQAAAQQRQRLRQVCDHLSQVEALAPMGRLLRLHPRTKASKAAAQSTRHHVWVWLCDRRLCQRCGLMPRRQDCRSYRASCPGHTPGHSQVHPSHKMRYTTVLGVEVPLVFCKACGSYGQTRFAKLRQACPGKPSAATYTMHKRLMQGRHPLSQVPLAPHTAWRPPVPKCRQPFAAAAPRSRPSSHTDSVVPGPGPSSAMVQASETADDPSTSHRPGVSPQVAHEPSASAPPGQVAALEHQLDQLAGFERGFVQAVQAADDSSDEDVFAHGFALDEP